MGSRSEIGMLVHKHHNRQEVLRIYASQTVNCQLVGTFSGHLATMKILEGPMTALPPIVGFMRGSLRQDDNFPNININKSVGSLEHPRKCLHYTTLGL